ncbi:MAG: hypothetical protein KJN78_10170 [Gammaproteobacteria bacterium]|nr:hypothetical protein [Gammaproteobacteria bacterium]
MHAWRGDTEGVFQWLDNAVAFADPGLSLIVAEPQFAPVHDDPRWAAFMERLGKSPRQLAAVVFETGLKDQAATGRLSGTD